MKTVTRRNYSVTFSETGKVTEFRNKRTGETYSVSDGGVSLIFEGTPVTIEEPCTVKQGDRSLVFDRGAVREQWEFQDEFCEKTVIFTPSRDGVLESVSVLQLSFAGARPHFHDDKTLWHCPMCHFAEYEKGGTYFGLEYPYWDGLAPENLSFSPWVTVKEGEPFVSEKAFLGAYSNTGKTVISHGPYPGKRKQKYHDLFDGEHTGLNQHFADQKLPETVDIEDETMDEGQIQAMHDFFRRYLPSQPLPEPGYYIWQNGWWAGLKTPDTACVDVLQESGVHDIMTAAMFYGHDKHPSCEPKYIRDTRIEPLGFPTHSESAQVTTLEDGHHSTLTEEEPKEVVTEYTPEFSAPAEYEHLITYGREHGVFISSFSTPNNSFVNGQDWVSLDPNGEPQRYLGTKVSCPACRDYMEHQLNVLCAIFDKYAPRLWCFDGRWMGFHEIAGYGYGTIKESPCYAENHGHLPGKSRYMEWKNIEAFKKALRERYPNLCLEQYYGMKRGSTWGLTYLNSDENFFETSGTDDNRFQNWHNENDRFRPTYLNYASVFGETPEEFEYSIISALSCAEYAQLSRGYRGLRDYPECRDILKRWKRWADENHRYLKDRTHLFGCPGDVAVDGSAHLIDGEGYVFLFCTVEEEAEAELSFEQFPGISEETLVSAVYPESVAAGTLSPDVSFRLSMKPHTAAVLKLTKKETK